MSVLIFRIEEWNLMLKKSDGEKKRNTVFKNSIFDENFADYEDVKIERILNWKYVLAFVSVGKGRVCREYALYRYVEIKKSVILWNNIQNIYIGSSVRDTQRASYTFFIFTNFSLLTHFSIFFLVHRWANMAGKVCVRACRNAKILKKERNFSVNMNFIREMGKSVLSSKLRSW